MRSIAEKMHIKAGSRTFLRNAPDGLLSHIGADDLAESHNLQNVFDYIHIFAVTQDQLADTFSTLEPHLAPKGALWVSWPKGGQLDTDLNLHEVIGIGYARALVESTCLSIDSTWSGLRFTHPKPGKIYRNSHAELITD